MNVKKMMGLTLFLLFSVLIVSIIYSVFRYVNIFEIDYMGLFYSLLQLSGLLGFLCITTLIVSGDFARIFDKYFGIDRIIKFQRKFAIATYFIVFSHPLFIAILQNFNFTYLIPNFVNLPLAFGVISLYIFSGVMVSSLMYKRISYNVWQYIHILTYILFFTIWIHGFKIGSSIGELPIKMMFYASPFLVLIGLIYRANYKLKNRKYKFFLKEIRNETEDTYTLVLKGNKKYSFKPGQFFFLRIDGRKLYARHPFSVSSSPNEENLEFTIKLGGRFTREAMNLKTGEKVKVEGPFGNFVLNEGDNDLVFIAGGVGITPFISMIKDNIKNNKRKISLIYSSRTEKNIIFKKYIDSIKENWFKKVYIITDEKVKGKENKEQINGRIDRDILLKYVKNFENKKFYICGPQKMNKDVSEALIHLGVKKENIFFEDFFW